MKRLIKAVFIVAGLILLLIAAVLIAVASQGDKLARAQVERALSHAFKTGVTVSEAELDLFDETLTLRGLVVANPPGFPKGPALTVSRTVIDFDAQSLLTDRSVINLIEIRDPRVNLYYDATEGSNLGVLFQEAERTSLERPSQMPRPARRAYVVKVLRCEGGRLEFRTGLVPGAEPGLDIAEFTLTDISRDQPVTAGQIGGIFLENLLRETANPRNLLRPLGDFLRKKLSEEPESEE